MISPYLRRPLRSLDDVLTRERTAGVAAKKAKPADVPAPAVSATARVVEPIEADTTGSIASNR